jgi:hypothetical protein
LNDEFGAEPVIEGVASNTRTGYDNLFEFVGFLAIGDLDWRGRCGQAQSSGQHNG